MQLEWANRRWRALNTEAICPFLHGFFFSWWSLNAITSINKSSLTLLADWSSSGVPFWWIFNEILMEPNVLCLQSCLTVKTKHGLFGEFVCSFRLEWKLWVWFRPKTGLRTTFSGGLRLVLVRTWCSFFVVWKNNRPAADCVIPWNTISLGRFPDESKSNEEKDYVCCVF